MLLEFSVGNYRSIKDIQTLDLRATSLKSEVAAVDYGNIFEIDGERVLKVVGIYGPNGSGKSNILKAFQVFRAMVRSSLNSEGVSLALVDPFRLSDDHTDHDGYFQVLILLNQKKYRYGFTLSRDGQVLQEWLNGPAEKNDTWYFKRTGDDIKVNEEWFKEGADLPQKLRPDTLFLTFVSAYDGAISGNIRRFIAYENSTDVNAPRRSLMSRIGGAIRQGGSYGASRPRDTDDMIENGHGHVVLEWLKKAGLVYSDIQIKKTETGRNIILLYKNIPSKDTESQRSIAMTLDQDESAGTQKFYSYIGRLYYRFSVGGIIFSDEIDNNFHPYLLIQLVRFFNDPTINKAGAQLIFTSHDTNLLQPDILRRDQIYFTEKSTADATILYALSDLKGIRNNADFARQYLAGFYGALPMLHSMKGNEQDSSENTLNE